MGSYIILENLIALMTFPKFYFGVSAHETGDIYYNFGRRFLIASLFLTVYPCIQKNYRLHACSLKKKVVVTCLNLLEVPLTVFDCSKIDISAKISTSSLKYLAYNMRI